MSFKEVAAADIISRRFREGRGGTPKGRLVEFSGEDDGAEAVDDNAAGAGAEVEA